MLAVGISLRNADQTYMYNCKHINILCRESHRKSVVSTKDNRKNQSESNMNATSHRDSIVTWILLRITL